MDTARSVSRITAFEYLALNYRPPSKKTSIRIGISATLAAFLAANGLAQSATVPLFQVDPDPTGNFTDISGGSGAPGLAPLAVTNKTAPTSFSSSGSRRRLRSLLRGLGGVWGACQRIWLGNSKCWPPQGDGQRKRVRDAPRENWEYKPLCG